MSKSASTGLVKQRPSAPSTKSFTRFEPSPTTGPLHRHRASTLNTPTPLRKSEDGDRTDVFNKTDSPDDDAVSPTLSKSTTLPDKFDELPIELTSLTDRFIESLTAKSYDQPPTIEHISDLFQEFYVTASNRVSIHISSLMTKLNREPSPARSKSSLKSRTPSTKSTESLKQDKSDSAQQMLTASEVTEKRKARKLLEYKRLVLEEAVERRVCEKIYPRIWRHKSTLDEVRDEKLRSKTAALALVGIGLKDLGIELDSENGKTTEDVQALLTPARDGLMQMNDEHYPLGKLQHLTKAHKIIVDTLYGIKGSSSSADEILPTLIYTLVTSPVEGISAISNLNFIQRFRASTKLDGESAYCMTNLEAAIGFLENVDLSSLRDEERPEGPPKLPSQPGSPTVEKSEPFPDMLSDFPTASATTATSAASASASGMSPGDTKPASMKKLAVNRHSRTLSDLFQPMTAANEAVQNKAKEGIESISNTLDNSLKFLFGRLQEQQNNPSTPTDVIVPKTLDEARELVNRPLGPDAVEEAIAASDTSSLVDKDISDSPGIEKSKSEDKLLSLFGGKRPNSIRERSVDSQRSNASSKKSPSAQANESTVTKGTTITSPTSISSTPLDSIKNIGSSLNPLSQIGNAFGGGFRGFGRPAMPTATSISSKSTDTKDKKQEDTKTEPEAVLKVPMDSPDKIARKIKEVKPPIAKYLDLESAADLKIGDVQGLLDDYKRLATLLTGLANGS